MISKSYLRLNGSQVSRLIFGGRVFALHNTITTLDVQQMQLDRVVPIYVGVIEEELLLQHQHIFICQSNLTKDGSSFQPVR